MKSESPRNSLTSEWELMWAKPIRKAEKLEERLRSVKKGENNDKVENQKVQHGGGRDRSRKNQAGKKNEKIIGRGFDGNRDASTSGTSGSAGGSPSSGKKIQDSFNAVINAYNSSVTPPSENGSSVGYSSVEGCFTNCYDVACNNNQGITYNPPICWVDPTNDDIIECARALEELAAVKFNAKLRYEYFSNSLMNEYYCKVNKKIFRSVYIDIK